MSVWVCADMSASCDQQLLQHEKLDLKLTPYKVLATSSKHGNVWAYNVRKMPHVYKQSHAGDVNCSTVETRNNQPCPVSNL